MNIIPTPKFYEKNGESFLLSYQAYIVMEADCSERNYMQAEILRNELFRMTGMRLHLVRGIPREGDISFRIIENEKQDYYELEILEKGIQLNAKETSLIYAIHTLLQIFREQGIFLEGCTIRDYSVMKVRGFYHDITRGRVPKRSFLKWLVDQLSAYKINQLQLYIENTYLFRDFSEVWRDDDPLEPEEILELDHYCYLRGIELVPSISNFSHLYKVLCTKSFGHLCELEDSMTTPFSAFDKQRHHTLNVLDSESMEFERKILDEYRQLFRTRRFNICADETFDLGKGKSGNYCREVGTGKAYVQFVEKICRYLLSVGCQPMMWGDILEKYPEEIRRIPREVIFLHWGYDAEVSPAGSQIYQKSGRTFYNCPGVSGWGRLLNDLQTSYQNISLMGKYAQEYGAGGLLNTDWGDFHHACHPLFSIVGMIYGAQEAWSGYLPEYETFNHDISVLEFGAEGAEILSCMDRLNQQIVYNWMTISLFTDFMQYKRENQEIENYLHENLDNPEKERRVQDCNCGIDAIKEEIGKKSGRISGWGKELLHALAITADGCKHLNEAGAYIAMRRRGAPEWDTESANQIAGRLEVWFYYYKQLWRSVSKESELRYIQNVICFIADYLRKKGEDDKK